MKKNKHLEEIRKEITPEIREKVKQFADDKIIKMSKRTAIEEVLYQHNKHFNKIDFSKWLSDNKDKIVNMEIDLAEMYSHFCVVCDREGRPLIKFKDFIKLNQNKDE